MRAQYRAIRTVGGVSRYLNSDYFCNTETPCIFVIDGWTIEVRFTEEDNYYQYAKVTQPNGVLWHGWSGYGVGAGFEGNDYGYSTLEREETLVAMWPEAIIG